MKESVTIADLDAILVEPVSVRLHGRDRIIRPLSLEQFLRFTENLNVLLGMKENVDERKLVDAYVNLVKCATDEISEEDVRQLTNQQMAALFKIIVDTVSGRIFAEGEKKNSPEWTVDRFIIKTPILLAEVIRETGWSVEYVLAMPARRFFALYRSFQEVAHNERVHHYLNLCDIAAISITTGKFQEELKGHFKKMLIGEKTMAGRRVFNADDPTENMMLAQLMMGAMNGR